MTARRVSAHEVIEGQATAPEELDDEYLKERAADVRDIGMPLRNIPVWPLSIRERLSRKKNSLPLT